MPLFRFDSTVVLFIHVPKTGGTSVEEALRSMGGRAALLSNSTRNYARCTPQHMQADVLSAFVPKGFYDLCFAVVRDPKSRLISEFKMRQVGRQKRGLAPLSFPDWVSQTFTRYQNNPYVFDNHIRPQTELVPKHAMIFHLEDGLETAVAYVADHLDCAVPELHQHRQGSAESITVPPEVNEQIADFYHDDYQRFGYVARTGANKASRVDVTGQNLPRGGIVRH